MRNLARHRRHRGDTCEAGCEDNKLLGVSIGAMSTGAPKAITNQTAAMRFHAGSAIRADRAIDPGILNGDNRRWDDARSGG